MSHSTCSDGMHHKLVSKYTKEDSAVSHSTDSDGMHHKVTSKGIKENTVVSHNTCSDGMHHKVVSKYTKEHSAVSHFTNYDGMDDKFHSKIKFISSKLNCINKRKDGLDMQLNKDEHFLKKHKQCHEIYIEPSTKYKK